MGVSEDRRQRTKDSNVARMKPAEYGNCTMLSSAPVFRSSTTGKIYKKRGGWVFLRTEDRGQRTEDRRQKTEDSNVARMQPRGIRGICATYSSSLP